MSCSDRLKEFDKVGIAGTNMLEEMGENIPAMDERMTIRYLVERVKELYGRLDVVVWARLMGGKGGVISVAGGWEGLFERDEVGLRGGETGVGEDGRPGSRGKGISGS